MLFELVVKMSKTKMAKFKMGYLKCLQIHCKQHLQYLLTKLQMCIDARGFKLNVSLKLPGLKKYT